MPGARARLLPAGPCAPNRCFLHKLWEHAPPGGINRKGPRSQGSLLGTSSLVCESSDRIGPGTRPGGANRGPPSPRARCKWKSYNNPKGSGPALSTRGWESSTTAAEAADVGGQVIKEKYPSPIRNFSSLVKRHLHPILVSRLRTRGTHLPLPIRRTMGPKKVSRFGHQHPRGCRHPPAGLL